MIRADDRLVTESVCLVLQPLNVPSWSQLEVTTAAQCMECRLVRLDARRLAELVCVD